jgi:hypothetical protein
MARDLAYGRKVIDRILKQLEAPTGLANKYAEAVLHQAVENAAGRPTPQAPMAAANLDVQGANIGPLAGGAPAEVAIGSEFGSTVYRQFHRPPNPRGYWLYPAAEDIRTLAAGDDMLEDILDRAIGGMI